MHSGLPTQPPKRLIKALTSSKQISCETECCKRQCLKELDNVYIKNMKKDYYTKSLKERKEYIFDKLSDAHWMKKIPYINVRNGNRLCPKSFMSSIGITKSTFYRHVESYKSGSCTSRPKIRQKNIVTLEAVSWLEDYLSSHGDRMPDSGDIALPYKTRKIALFRQYNRDMESRPRISRASFYKLWKSYFSQAKVKKVF